MAKKFENLNKVPLFGSYVDPFADRRGEGPTRPPMPMESAKTDLRRLPENSAVWLGHSSVLLRLNGLHVLIDPVFGRYASPVPGFGPKRFAGAEIDPGELPDPDLILITHDHYDHLEQRTIRALRERTGRFVVPIGVGRRLRRFGVAAEKITELDWHGSTEYAGLRVNAIPTQHDSGRSPFSMNRTLWCGFVLQCGQFTVLHSGDGGYSGLDGEIRQRYGAPDLALLECGQYNVRWHAIHHFPEETARTAQELEARLAVPIHWGAYVLSNHPWDDPPRRFALRAKELAVPFRIPKLREPIIIEK